MGCGCTGPCGPQTPRCSCQLACWLGPPGEYEDCILACDPDCDFPKVTSLPSMGFRCDDLTEDACEVACADTYDDDIADCALIVDPTSECLCEATARGNQQTCIYGCRSAGVPAWLTCEATDLDEDEACCATTLGTCENTCEHAFLAAVPTPEEAWFTCVGACYADEAATEGSDCEGGGSAVFDTAGCIFECTTTKTVAEAGAVRDDRICRAECIRDEKNRDNASERKTPECGGRYYVCTETCSAYFHYALTGCIAAYGTCVNGCGDDEVTKDACIRACNATYRACYWPIWNDQVSCLFGCCKQEYSPARHGHAFGACYLPCHATKAIDRIPCCNSKDNCVALCAPGDTDCLLACDGSFTTCMLPIEAAFHTCITACTGEKDCPACYTIAIELADSEHVGGGYEVTAPVDYAGFPSPCD